MVAIRANTRTSARRLNLSSVPNPRVRELNLTFTVSRKSSDF